MPALHPDRTPAAATRLARALKLLTQRRGAEAPPQTATLSELCRLAGVSRNSVYRYYPSILAALRVQQGRPPDEGSKSCVSPLTADNALLKDQLSKLVALVDHYYTAYREVLGLLERREKEIAALRRRLGARPTPIDR